MPLPTSQIALLSMMTSRSLHLPKSWMAASLTTRSKKKNLLNSRKVVPAMSRRMRLLSSQMAPSSTTRSRRRRLPSSQMAPSATTRCMTLKLSWALKTPSSTTRSRRRRLLSSQMAPLTTMRSTKRNARRSTWSTPALATTSA